jgi:hypothetical protein
MTSPTSGELYVKAMVATGRCGEDLSVSPDADPQTKLLALVGRRA